MLDGLDQNRGIEAGETGVRLRHRPVHQLDLAPHLVRGGAQALAQGVQRLRRHIHADDAPDRGLLCQRHEKRAVAAAEVEDGFGADGPKCGEHGIEPPVMRPCHRPGLCINATSFTGHSHVQPRMAAIVCIVASR
jgi:hypothetical protein